MVTFLVILYIIGCVIGFFLTSHSFYKEFGELDVESFLFSIFLSLFSWLSVISMAFLLCVGLIRKFLSNDKKCCNTTVEKLNNLYKTKE